MSLRVVSLLALVACASVAASASADVPQQLDRDLTAVAAGKVRHARAVKGYNDQSFTIGGIFPYSRQLLSRTVYKSSTWMTVHKEVLTVSSNAAIDCIQITDLIKNGKNAAVTVKSGGVGHNAATLQFKSLRGEKINYVVTIWGR